MYHSRASLRSLESLGRAANDALGALPDAIAERIAERAAEA
jgi:hypothetical protein